MGSGWRLVGTSIMVMVVVALVAVSCGGDDDDATNDTTAADQSDSSAGAGDSSDDGSDDGGSAGAGDSSDDGSDDGGSAGAGDGSDDGSDDGGSAGAGDGSDDGGSGPGDAGTLVLGEETIVLVSARCFLEEQDAAAGGGKILFVVQASGTNADGEEVLVDVSRYDEDSDFTGDDILVDIGDPFSEDAVSWSSNAELGTVQIDGTTVSAEGLTFTNFDDFTEVEGSFTIDC